MATSGTYVYCLIAADRRPVVRRRFTRLPGMGLVRLLDVDRGLWLVVADAPLSRYGGESINRKLSDLDWVSRAAIAHEAVVESFINRRAVLPMKLFTIFTSDDRALEQVRGDRRRVDAMVKRVTNHVEWGVRIAIDRSHPRAPDKAKSGAKSSGAVYLSQKKAQRDSAVELAGRARETVTQIVRSSWRAFPFGQTQTGERSACGGRSASARRGIPGPALPRHELSSAGDPRGTPARAARLPRHLERPLGAVYLRQGLM